MEEVLCLGSSGSSEARFSFLSLCHDDGEDGDEDLSRFSTTLSDLVNPVAPVQQQQEWTLEKEREEERGLRAAFFFSGYI